MVSSGDKEHAEHFACKVLAAWVFVIKGGGHRVYISGLQTILIHGFQLATLESHLILTNLISNPWWPSRLKPLGELDAVAESRKMRAAVTAAMAR